MGQGLPNGSLCCLRTRRRNMTETFDIKYRPKTYEEVIGQEKAIKQLEGSVVRSYILQGPSGSGKTTLSRIFASTLNAAVLELDTASIGKQDVESIKRTAYYKPMFNEKSVIILDEVHNLSSAAWDSLLKVIEEGPSFLTWMLVTTEFHKVPTTIRTRSRVVEVTAVPIADVRNHLMEIAKKEGKELNEGIAHEIASHANGGVREAVKLLESYLTTGELNIGTSQRDMIEIIQAVYEQDYHTINEKTENFSEREVEMLIKFISDYITMILLVSSTKEKTDTLGEDILRDKTSINPELIYELREMQAAIMSTFKFVGTTHVEQTVGVLYHLMDVLMRHYNMFNDKQSTTRGALNWVSSQLSIG